MYDILTTPIFDIYNEPKQWCGLNCLAVLVIHLWWMLIAFHYNVIQKYHNVALPVVMVGQCCHERVE